MRVAEFVRFAVAGLWRQRIRTALTVAGVAVGACSLAFSLSLGVGLQQVIVYEFESRPGFWEISVTPGEYRHVGSPPPVVVPEGIGPDRHDRIRKELEQAARQTLPVTNPTPLDTAKLAEIRGLPDVKIVRTFRHQFGMLRLGERTRESLVVATRCDRPELTDMLIRGRLPVEDGPPEAVVPEMVLYHLGVRTDAELKAVLGTPIQVEFGGTVDQRQRALVESVAGGVSGSLTLKQGAALLKLLAELPTLLDRTTLSLAEKEDVKRLFTVEQKKTSTRYPVVGQFTIVGVLRGVTDADPKDTPWHLRQSAVFANASGGEVLIRKLHNIGDAYDNAQVTVRPGSDLPAVVAAIESMGFRTQSSLKWFYNAQREVIAIGVALNIFSWVALGVAAIGITNTLVTNVVERTREIGILKAIGASRRQILMVFLFEGTLIGSVGGLVGLTVARLGAIPLDAVVRAEIQKQMRGETMASEAVFVFPAWLLLTTFTAAAGVTTLAAIYPARRASSVDPIEALKYA